MSENTTVVASAPVQVNVRDIQAVAEKFAEVCPTYKIRDTKSTGFRCMITKENEKENWKKGLHYFLSRYSKGVNIAMWAYSTKGGAHLKEYNEMFRVLANAKITCLPLGHAVQLRIQIPDQMADENIGAEITEFFNTVDPVVEQVRSKIVVSVKESKKKVKVEKTEAPAPAPVEAVAPIEAPEVEIPAEIAEPVQEEKSSKKAKSKSKAK